MADNVAITAGSGTTIATDDVSGVHYQIVKLADPTLDTTTPIGNHTNPLKVATGALSGNGSVSSATNVFSLDLLGYNSIAVQVTSAGTTCTITYEMSNDNSTWVAVPMVDLSSITATPATTSTTTGLRGSAVTFRYFRARVSTYTSGTVTAYYCATADAFMAPALPVDLGGQTLPTVTTVGTVTNITNQGHLVDNAAFTDGTTRLMMDGFIFDETAGTALTENDAAAARIDSKRALIHVIEDATTRGQRLAVTTRGSNYIEGPTAHDSALAANPVTIGAKAISAEPTAVQAADVATLITDLVGKLITLPYANPELFISGYTSDITNTTSTAVIAAQGSGVRAYVTQLLVTNSHATVGTFVNILDGATVIYSAYAAPAGGGFSITLPVPLRGTANTALNAQCVTTGANVRVSASGYKGA